MKPEVAKAVSELRARFGRVTVTAEDDGDGGAVVSMSPLDPGPAYVQRETWIKFAISYLYPDADVYPLFVRPDLQRVDGNGHGEGIASGEFRGEPALQLSRRSNRRDPAFDTAARKVAKVLEWLRAQ